MVELFCQTYPSIKLALILQNIDVDFMPRDKMVISLNRQEEQTIPRSWIDTAGIGLFFGRMQIIITHILDQSLLEQWLKKQKWLPHVPKPCHEEEKVG